MSDKNKNKRVSPGEFFRYLRKELKGSERNSLERELQKDPFAEEAMEGFDLLGPENAAKDFSELKSRLAKRTNRRMKMTSYRIAASIAVLAVLSVIFLLTNDNPTVTQIAENTEKKVTLEIEKRRDLTDSEANKKIPEEQKMEIMENDTPRVQNKNEAKSDEEEKSAYREMKDDSKADSNERASQKSEKAYSEPERRLAPASAVARESLSATGDEVVVTYSAKKRAVKAADIEDYSPPAPLSGKQEFEKYIKENIIRPDTLSGQTETVEISFLVRTDGTIDSIKPLTSPGKDFAEEAIRLIKSGPAWKPAERDGKIINDSVRMIITFR
jgi:hypothetical protein